MNRQRKYPIIQAQLDNLWARATLSALVIGTVLAVSTFAGCGIG